MENVLQHLFELKNSTIRNLQSHQSSYRESLVVNLVLKGFQPPKWLLQHVVRATAPDQESDRPPLPASSMIDDLSRVYATVTSNKRAASVDLTQDASKRPRIEPVPESHHEGFEGFDKHANLDREINTEEEDKRSQADADIAGRHGEAEEGEKMQCIEKENEESKSKGNEQGITIGGEDFAKKNNTNPRILSPASSMIDDLSRVYATVTSNKRAASVDLTQDASKRPRIEPVPESHHEGFDKHTNLDREINTEEEDKRSQADADIAGRYGEAEEAEKMQCIEKENEESKTKGNEQGITIGGEDYDIFKGSGKKRAKGGKLKDELRNAHSFVGRMTRSRAKLCQPRTPIQQNTLEPPPVTKNKKRRRKSIDQVRFATEPMERLEDPENQLKASEIPPREAGFGFDMHIDNKTPSPILTDVRPDENTQATELSMLADLKNQVNSSAVETGPSGRSVDHGDVDRSDDREYQPSESNSRKCDQDKIMETGAVDELPSQQSRGGFACMDEDDKSHLQITLFERKSFRQLPLSPKILETENLAEAAVEHAENSCVDNASSGAGNDAQTELIQRSFLLKSKGQSNCKLLRSLSPLVREDVPLVFNIGDGNHMKTVAVSTALVRDFFNFVGSFGTKQLQLQIVSAAGPKTIFSVAEALKERGNNEYSQKQLQMESSTSKHKVKCLEEISLEPEGTRMAFVGGSTSSELQAESSYHMGNQIANICGKADSGNKKSKRCRFLSSETALGAFSREFQFHESGMQSQSLVDAKRTRLNSEAGTFVSMVGECCKDDVCLDSDGNSKILRENGGESSLSSEVKCVNPKTFVTEIGGNLLSGSVVSSVATCPTSLPELHTSLQRGTSCTANTGQTSAPQNEIEAIERLAVADIMMSSMLESDTHLSDCKDCCMFLTPEDKIHMIELNNGSVCKNIGCSACPTETSAGTRLSRKQHGAPFVLFKKADWNLMGRNRQCHERAATATPLEMKIDTFPKQKALSAPHVQIPAELPKVNHTVPAENTGKTIGHMVFHQPEDSCNLNANLQSFLLLDRGYDSPASHHKLPSADEAFANFSFQNGLHGIGIDLDTNTPLLKGTTLDKDLKWADQNYEIRQSESTCGVDEHGLAEHTQAEPCNIGASTKTVPDSTDFETNLGLLRNQSKMEQPEKSIRSWNSEDKNLMQEICDQYMEIDEKFRTIWDKETTKRIMENPTESNDLSKTFSTCTPVPKCRALTSIGFWRSHALDSHENKCGEYSGALKDETKIECSPLLLSAHGEFHATTSEALMDKNGCFGKGIKDTPELSGCFPIQEESMNEIENADDIAYIRTSGKGFCSSIEENATSSTNSLRESNLEKQNSPLTISMNKHLIDRMSKVDEAVIGDENGDPSARCLKAQAPSANIKIIKSTRPASSFASNMSPAKSNSHKKFGNILTNVKSLLPLVQKKQPAPAIVTGKRDIKVKALEVAEAAKRLEEKREQERIKRKDATRKCKMERNLNDKMKDECPSVCSSKSVSSGIMNKKPAGGVLFKSHPENPSKVEHSAAYGVDFKLRRAMEAKTKIDQEKTRKLMEDQQRKEKGKHKRELELAQKKRHREEADRKEREDKRKRIEEAQRHLKEMEEKVRADKEEREKRRRVVEDIKRRAEEEAKKQIKLEKEKKVADCRNVLVKDSKLGQDCQQQSSKIVCLSKVWNSQQHLSQAIPTEKDVSLRNLNQTEDGKSYEITPYKPSNNEDDDYSDDNANNKYIPAWARKENLYQQLINQRHIDPDTIFVGTKTCSLNKVFGANESVTGRNFNKRGHSSEWQRDRYTSKEEYLYKLRMGYINEVHDIQDCFHS